MFYCNPCAKPRDWPETGFKSYGRCELCQTVGDCNDRPSKLLPLPPGERPILTKEGKYVS